MKHAKGLGQLIKVRGPDRYRNDLEITVLKASRGLVVCSLPEALSPIPPRQTWVLTMLQVMHSMFSGEDCFLASEEWHQIMRQQYTADMPRDLHDLIEEFFAFFTYTPSLVHKLYRLKEMDISTPEALEIISDALEQALRLQGRIGAWYEQFAKHAPPPTEALSSRNDTVFPVVLIYSDMIYATIYCAYYSCMVIIHEVLRTFSYPGPHEAMVIYFRDQICKSVEYCSTGLLGPSRMGFALRVSMEVADPPTKTWLIARLEEFSKIYAAANPDNNTNTPRFI